MIETQDLTRQLMQREIESLRQQLTECEREREKLSTAYSKSLEARIPEALQLAAVMKERDELVDWVCHNGGLLNEWAKDWNPAKHPPLTNFIRDRLIAALAKLGADKTGEQHE